MPKRYIISLQPNQPYPFEGPKSHVHQVIIRRPFSFLQKQEQKNLHNNIHLLLALNSPYLIQITQVLQNKGKSFVIDYEYVPENLSQTQRVAENNFLSSIREKLIQLGHKLSQSGINIELKIEDIGISSQGDPKLFVPPLFQIQAEEQKKNLNTEYQNQIDKLLEQQFNYKHSHRDKALSQLSDYSYRLDKKIAQIENKINRRKRRKSNDRSSPQRNSDDSKKPVQGNIVMENLSKRSNNSITSQKTRYSLIQAQQLVQPRVHKSSFNEFTTTSYKLNEFTRDDSLKKRLESALEKTQNAFKIYENRFKHNRRF